MLVLTRNDGESIRIGDDVIITISVVNGAQVKVAIEAPRDVNIVREELLYRDGSIPKP